MSNTSKADPFRKLLKWTIILLILFALLATGYVLLDKYQQGERERQAQRIAEENKQIIEENNRARQEQLAMQEQRELRDSP